MTTDDTTRISVWSGPRNISTALMYSFRSRADTTVFDEPLLAHYFRVTGASQPHRDEVLQSMDADGNRVVDEVLLGDVETPVVMFKNMAHHLVDLDEAFLEDLHNVILMRDPRHMLPSLAKGIPSPRLFETGLPGQVKLLRHELEAGRTPVVVETRRLLEDPPEVLEFICDACGIEWDPAMLTWEAGPKPEDGVWGQFWYDAVHRSTGFGPPRATTRPCPPHLVDLLDECMDLYDQLAVHAI